MILHLFIFAKRGKIGAISQKNIDLLSDAAEKEGHTLEIIYSNECQMKFDKKPHLLIQNHEIKKINAVIIKANPSANKLPFNSRIIKQFELLGIPVVNRQAPVMRAKNKIRTLQILSHHNITVPKSYVVSDSEYIDDVVEDIGKFPVILKTVSGSHGQGVSMIESKRALKSVIEMFSKERLSDPLVIQEYIKESKGKDLRIFIVGRTIVGAMERISTKRGEFRSNFHLGGKVKIASLSKKEKELAINTMKACHLDFAGIDILRTKSGPKVIEINANPGLEGITKATESDIAGEIIKYTVRKIQRLERKKEKVKNGENGKENIKKEKEKSIAKARKDL